MNKYRVLLYYHYVSLENLEDLKEKQRELCQRLNLRGRIIIAHEGINGTVSGTIEMVNEYMEVMKADARFQDMPFKIDEYDQHAFKKLSVKVRPELVNLSLEHDVNPLELSGKHLNPQAFLEAMKQEDTVIIDARNDYEFDLGHFRNALRPNIRNFRELPQWIKENQEILEDKKILTYCTGGVRCEKFSGWLLQEGYKDVGQLDGGIATYGYDLETKGQLWDGLMYVFDERISVPINRVEHHVVGKDYYDGTPCERYVNCANPSCNQQILCSEANEKKYYRSCSYECFIHSKNRYVSEHGLSQADVDQASKLFNLQTSFKLMENMPNE